MTSRLRLPAVMAALFAIALVSPTYAADEPTVEKLPVVWDGDYAFPDSGGSGDVLPMTSPTYQQGRKMADGSQAWWLKADKASWLKVRADSKVGYACGGDLTSSEKPVMRLTAVDLGTGALTPVKGAEELDCGMILDFNGDSLIMRSLPYVEEAPGDIDTDDRVRWEMGSEGLIDYLVDLSGKTTPISLDGVPTDVTIGRVIPGGIAGTDYTDDMGKPVVAYSTDGGTFTEMWRAPGCDSPICTALESTTSPAGGRYLLFDSYADVSLGIPRVIDTSTGAVLPNIPKDPARQYGPARFSADGSTLYVKSGVMPEDGAMIDIRLDAFSLPDMSQVGTVVLPAGDSFNIVGGNVIYTDFQSRALYRISGGAFTTPVGSGGGGLSLGAVGGVPTGALIGGGIAVALALAGLAFWLARRGRRQVPGGQGAPAGQPIPVGQGAPPAPPYQRPMAPQQPVQQVPMPPQPPHQTTALDDVPPPPPGR